MSFRCPKCHRWNDEHTQDCSVRLQAELARLRAEVERLKSEEECPACGPAIDRAEKAERERDEALAQVAVLVKEANRVTGGHSPDCFLSGEPEEGLARVLRDLPAEARALLDQLERWRTATIGLEASVTRLESQLQRAEAVVRAAKKDHKNCMFVHEDGGGCRVCKALAAWEEGNG